MAGKKKSARRRRTFVRNTPLIAVIVLLNLQATRERAVKVSRKKSNRISPQ